jgi:hypothetical protein
MNNLMGLNFGLSSIPLLSNTVTRSISAENPTGEPGGGARATLEGFQPSPLFKAHPATHLGPGWKAQPCLSGLMPNQTVTLADIEGPGIIQHIWMTAPNEAYRTCILRMYWDEEETPSVEVPYGDLFANMHGLSYNVNSLPIAVNPSGGFNSYWPMPFRRHARITVESQHTEPIMAFFYQITYALGELPEEMGTFHAQWRRSITTRDHPEHVILDGVRGKGHYVGTAIGWTQFSDGWWGEGEIKFYMDGDTDHPTICGTGTEDYFGGAWCFGDTYSTPFLGYPLWRKEPGEVPLHGLYRWHVMDPIRFHEELKVTIQALGWWLDMKFEPLTDDICSVAKWYQGEPHGPFPKLLDLASRWPRCGLKRSSFSEP